jgi:uncharacterized protein YmfQ (DUF2313 family)
MSVPIFSADDYAAAMANLLPRGRAWPRDPDTNLMRLMGALAPTYQRNGATAAALVADIFPRTTTALIPEWEETLGLPDPCSPLNPTTEQRRAAILAKFIASGGQSAPYFISVAAALGYTITVTNYSPFRVGIDAVGSPLNGKDWAQTWAIGAGQTTVSYFAVGQSTVGDPLASWGNAILECRLKQIKPAHTILLFQYGISTTMPFNQLDWPNPRAAQRLSFDLMRNFLSH